MNETSTKSAEIVEDRAADHALMQRIAEGDRVAFDVVSQRFHGLIYSTIYKVLNHVEDSEDVAQEVLLSLWKKAATYEPSKGKLMTWIATMSRNRGIDRFRSHQRRIALREKLEKEVTEGAVDPAASGRSELYLSETRRMLKTAVVELSAEQREVIHLAYFEGLTQSQIASRIDRPLGTVKARIRRGVENLRGVVKAKMGSDYSLEDSGLIG